MDFYESVERGDVEKVRKAIEKGIGKDGFWGNEKKKNDTALHVACSKGFLEIVQLLLQLDSTQIDVNKKNTAQVTPFYYACANRREAIIQLMVLDKRVDILSLDTQGRSPLSLMSFNLETFILLFSDPRNIDRNAKYGQYSLFHTACSKNRHEIVKYLLETDGIDYNSCTNDGTTPIQTAARIHSLNVFKLLISDSRVSLNNLNNSGQSLFSIICSNCSSAICSEMLELLLKEDRFDFNNFFQRDLENGETPIYHICSKGCSRVLPVIVERSSTFEIDWNKTEKKMGMTPLYISCNNGHLDVVKVLLRIKEIDVNKSNANGATPFYISCQQGHSNIVELLLNDERVEINQCQKHGASPFFQSCQQGHVTIVSILVGDPRIDINLSWHHCNWSPLMAAVYNSNLLILQTILSSKRKINILQKTSDNFLNIESGWNVLDIVNYKIKNRNIQRSQNSGQILQLIENFLSSPVKCSNECRQKLNLKEMSLEEELIFGCSDGDDKLVEELLKKGANLNTTDEKGRNLIWFAKYRNQAHIVNLLNSIK